MFWKQIIVDVPDQVKDALVGELSDDGVAGVWEDGAIQEGRTRLVIYFGESTNLESVESRIRSMFGRTNCETPVITHGTVQDRDWTEEWKKSYTSFPVGEEFFVIPSWENTGCPEGRLPIRIDPGQAFGTGTHETTQLTMEALERWVEPHHRVLDVGTGSGILSIASRLLGAREVLACDVDPVAVNVARSNIRRNSEREVWTFCGSVHCVPGNSIHLLLGNLTADVIAQLFEEFHRVLVPRGLAILSGILHEQREDILEMLRTFHYPVHEEISRGEWLALVTEKHVG